MDLYSYTGIIIAAIVVPGLMTPIIIGIIWCYNRESREFTLLVIMRSIISKNNIDNVPTLFVCNRKLSRQFHFMLISMFIISTCVQVFFIVAVVDVSYECINDPKLDCFKKKDHIKITDTSLTYNDSPVNCSSITQNDFVLCYRITFLDPERAFIGAAAAYLVFKAISFGLFIVAHIMLSAVRKWNRNTVRCIKVVVFLVIVIVLFIPLILRTYVDEVESAIRKLSNIVFVQAGFIVLIVTYFILLPWETFKESDEYFRDVSLSRDVYANEMN